MINRFLRIVKAAWGNRILRHISIWAFAFGALYLNISLFETPPEALKIASTIVLPGLLPVYVHFFALSRYFERQRYAAYGLWVVAILAASALWAEWLHRLIEHNPEAHTSGMGLAILYLIVSTGGRYFSRGISQQYRLQEAEAKQLRTELALLRSRIDPHFLFNTLNSLYALSLDNSERTPEVILKLSDMMRYVLDSSQHNAVPLTDEIRFLHNYVELETLRFGKAPDIRLRVTGDPDTRRIAPMLLIPFVENAFKHGLNNAGAQEYVHIDIDLTADRFLFAIENGPPARDRGPGDGPNGKDTGGLGLENVRRRLALLYPDSHRLAVAAGERTFRVELEIEL